jgi:hypothetical protein
MSTLDEQLGSMIWRLIAKLGIFVALLSAVVILYRIPKLGRLAPSGLAVLALGVGTITGLGSDASRRVATWGADVYENWKFNESAFPNAEKREVAKFIRENTPASAIVATNDFCCFGDFWWTETLRATRRQQTPNWDLILRESAWGQKLLAGDDGSDREVIRYAENSISFGGSSFQLAAEAQRRFLILGLKWQLTGFPPAPTPQQIERMSASLNFANSPSTSAVERLRRYGVSGYVVNLELTSGKDYSRFAEELFRNGKFAYLKIG